MSSKLAKEEFVSGHSGTSLEEIYILTTTLVAGYLLRCVLLVCLPFVVGKSAVLSFLIDYVTVIAPGVLVFTVLADYALHILGFIIFATLLLYFYGLSSNSIASGIKNLSESTYPLRLPCLTLTRTFVTLITAIAILAVDFQIFPRRFAKAETYGTGLMDVGVGAFIMSHGLTSPEARGVGSGRRKTGSVLKDLLPLIVIGVLRLLAVKSTHYQEHVSEYGVHWNFFFTIATVRLLATFLQPVLTVVPGLYGVASLLTALCYQLALSQLGLSQYVQHGPYGDGSRPTLLSANREGLGSCVGYLAIYLGHVQIGRWLFKPRKSVMQYVPVLCGLLCLCTVFYCLTLCCDGYIEPISRRLVNLAYITWIFSYGTLIVGLFLLTDIVVCLLSHHPPNTSVSIVEAVDYNQLGFFLLANLLTGLVNFSMDTLSADWSIALTVLHVYMAVLALVFCLLLKLNIKIKL